MPSENPAVRDEFLSEEDLDLANLSEAEFYAYWDLWLHQAQATNHLDAHLYSHGVFVEEPRIEPFPPRPEERRVLDFMLAGEGEILSTLREQLSAVLVRRRSIAKAGFYVDLEVAAAVRELSGRPSFCIVDVVADVHGLELGMGLRLWIRSGIADQLEGFTYDEELPFHWELDRLAYIDAFRSTDPPIERPASAPRRPGNNLTVEAREPPPPHPRP